MSRLFFRLFALILGSSVLHVAAVAAGDVHKDALGDPLPPGALARLGTVRLRHAGPVTMLRFSPDGKRLLSRGNSSLCLWSTVTGKQLRRQTSDSYSITGTFTAEGGVLHVFHDKTGIHLVDAMTGKRLRTIPQPDKPIRGLILAPNGKYLGVVVGEGSGRVHLLDTATSKEIAKFTIAHPGYRPPIFSTDGKSLAEVDYESGVRIRATATGMVRSRIRGLKRTELTSLALSPDGKKLATGGYDHIVHLWDTTTGKEDRALQHQSASLEFSPDGKTLVCGGWNGIVSLFDTATGKKRRSFTAHVGAVKAITYSSDGKILATGGGGLNSHRIPLRFWHRDCTIRLWDAASGKELSTALGPRADVLALAYSPDGKQLASAGKDSLIRLWRVADGKLLRWLEGHGGTVYSLAFSPDGKVLASASEDKSARLWETATGKVLHELKGHDGEVTAVAFSPDGKTLASVGGDKIYLWDASTGKEIHMLRAPNSGAYAVAFSPDGRILATGGGQAVLLPPSPEVDNSIRLWNPRSGQERRRLPGDRNDFAVFTLTFSPDGKTIASGGINGSIRLWEAATGAERLTINSAGDGAIVFSPDGRTLAAASPRNSDGTIRLWDAFTGKQRRLISGHDGEVYAVAFSPDGKTLASASQDTTVLLWDVVDLARRHPPTTDLAAKELEGLWEKLAQSDAGQAYQAIRTLVETKQTVPFLQQRLHPIRVTVNPQQIDKFIADLDSDQFEAREHATAELKKLGGLAEPALRKVIASRPTLEVRRRIEDLLDPLDHHVLSREELRGLRAVETLEHIGSPEARRVLATLARGTPGIRLTDEARAVVERLSRRRAFNP
ncbi:MAG: PQQ-binding-like beta-propeller repeat protein [Gemmataceae bacterium]